MEKDLETLRSLTNDLKVMDKFIDLYGKMLNDAWAACDWPIVYEMQKILLGQCEFMMNEWIKQNHIIEQIGGVHQCVS